MPEITLYSGEYEIIFYGKYSHNVSPGIKAVSLADGTLVTSKSYKKDEFSIQIDVIDDENLANLLERSDELFYYQDDEGNKTYFYIVGNISHVPYTRFEGYHSAVIQAREA